MPRKLPSAILSHPQGTEAPLNENSAASTHELPPYPPIKELPNWGLPRTADKPTFKAEAPRPSKECLEDIVCIEICGQGEKQGRNKKVKKKEKCLRGIYDDTENGSPKLSQFPHFPQFPKLQTRGEEICPTLCKPYPLTPLGACSLLQPQKRAFFASTSLLHNWECQRLSPHYLPIMLGAAIEKAKIYHILQE